MKQNQPIQVQRWVALFLLLLYTVLIMIVIVAMKFQYAASIGEESDTSRLDVREKVIHKPRLDIELDLFFRCVDIVQQKDNRCVTGRPQEIYSGGRTQQMDMFSMCKNQVGECVMNVRAMSQGSVVEDLLKLDAERMASERKALCRNREIAVQRDCLVTGMLCPPPSNCGQ